MRSFLLRRLLSMVPTFFGITVLTFAVMHLAPGDPLSLRGADAGLTTQATVDQQRERHGLDRPIVVQYLVWVGKVATLDFGRSFQDGQPVATKIADALPRTLLLSTLALLLSYLIAIPLGAWAAVKPYSVRERLTTVALFVLYSLPSFWVAVMLVLFFATARGVSLFPMQGLTSDNFAALSFGGQLLDLAWHLALPVAVLTYGSLALLSRYMRAAMLEVIRQDYIRTARAKGLTERAVIFRHALRNSLLPIVTLLGLTLPSLIGGSVIVEQIFGIHGMGLLAFDAILSRDYPVVMGITTLVALLTMVAMLFSDLLYAAVDPRIDLEASR